MTLLETSIKNQTRNLGLTLGQLAILSDVRPQVLIPGLNGRAPLRIADVERVRHTLSRIQRLVDSFRPFPISLQDTRVIRFLLSKSDDGELKNLFSPRAKELSVELDRILSHAEVGRELGG